MQMIALFILVVAALVIELPSSSSKGGFSFPSILPTILTGGTGSDGMDDLGGGGGGLAEDPLSDDMTSWTDVSSSTSSAASFVTDDDNVAPGTTPPRQQSSQSEEQERQTLTIDSISSSRLKKKKQQEQQVRDGTDGPNTPNGTEIEATNRQQQQQQQTEKPQQHRSKTSIVGLIAILAASMTSGLAGAWTQKSLQLASTTSSPASAASAAASTSRNAFLLSLELSVCSTVFLLSGLLITGITSSYKNKKHQKRQSEHVETSSRFMDNEDEDDEDIDVDDLSSTMIVNDATRIWNEGWWSGWTIQTWIPLCTNAAGGILVGIVTKYAGTVEKGFALIIGLFGSGILQNIVARRNSKAATPASGKDGGVATSTDDSTVIAPAVAPHQWIGGFLAALSLWMHSAFPPSKH